MNPGNYIFVPDDFELDPNLFHIHKKYQGFIKALYVTAGTIKDRTDALAKEILLDRGDCPLVILCVLRGAFRFCKDLYECIEKRCEGSSNYHKVEFIRARSYNNDQQGDIVVEGLDLIDIRGKHVLIVEDLVDSGNTLFKISEIVRGKEPASLKIAVLAYKRNAKNTLIVPDFIGFSIPDEWIIGHNIDYNGHFRDLEHIAALNDAGKEYFKNEN